MMKKLFLYLVLLLASAPLISQTITFTASSGWLETAFVKWTPVPNATSYNVYYSNNGTTYTKIDDQLIRSYGSYYRADAMGLAAGNYTIKVAPVIDGVEATATITDNLTVLAHDRTGFAFHGGRVPGAYKADGTPKDGAIVLYITENNKNNVSLVITGATSNPCVGLQTILDAFKKGKETRPLIVRMIGQITDLDYMLNGDIVIENKNLASSYITLEGVGDDAVADGWGIRIKNASNVEVNNLGTMNCNSGEGDNISLQQGNDYVWVHNCDLFYGDAGGDSDQAKGDGALDNKNSTYVTFSYNHFWDSGKASLLGLSEKTTEGLYVTYHHNWFDHSDSRHPRVRYYSTHVYNNYYDGNAKYGVGSTLGSSVFVENNIFRNCKYPMLTSKQGTDIFYDSKGTFSGEAGGTIKAYNNIMTGQTRFVPYNAVSNAVEFDAVEVIARDEAIGSTIKSKLGANTYNNFDTDPALYVKACVPDAPEVAKTKLMTYAGRVQGGDFKWTFNNAVDDASYAVNTALKAALTSYSTSLVAVQGEGSIVEGSQKLICTTNNNEQTVLEDTAIETIIFIWSGDAADAIVTGLPAAGVSYVKDISAKMITITGTPTANIDYSIVTSGPIGTPTTVSGTIALEGLVTGDMVHSFTEAGKTSSFYNIIGNLSDSKGTVTYAGLTLTQCLKMESSTSISFTTSGNATLILVFNEGFVGKVKVNGDVYNPIAGVLTITVPAGENTITKGDTSNLFYISVAYAITETKTTQVTEIKLYPNPVISNLLISSSTVVRKVEIFSMTGVLLKSEISNVRNIDVSNLSKGGYLVKVFTDTTVYKQMILKK